MLARFLAKVAAEARGNRYADDCALWALDQEAKAAARADQYAEACARWAMEGVPALYAEQGGAIGLGQGGDSGQAEIGAYGASPLAQALGPTMNVEQAFRYLRERRLLLDPAEPPAADAETQQIDPGCKRGYRPAFAPETALGKRPPR